MTEHKLAPMTEHELTQLALADRLQLVLVRMDGCRFISPAQDAKRIIDALEQAGDWCRDVNVYHLEQTLS